MTFPRTARELLDAGVLTQEEFDTQKKEVITAAKSVKANQVAPEPVPSPFRPSSQGWLLVTVVDCVLSTTRTLYVMWTRCRTGEICTRYFFANYRTVCDE